MNDKLLRIYLNDHLAGSVGAIELAERCLKRNEDHPLGAFLQTFLPDVREDQAVLKGLLERVGGTENVAKQAGAWLMEKAERLKPDGSPFAYSDLDRVVELEALFLGVRGKLGLWDALDALGDSTGRFGDVDFPRLKQRAEQQLEKIERHRLDAIRLAFASNEPAPDPDLP